MRNQRVDLVAVLVLALGWMFAPVPQHLAAQQESGQYEHIDGAVIYDHDPSTKLGDDVFGNVIADFENDVPGRCSHGGPVCLEYPNGNVVAFYANTSDHNLDGWSEYAVSGDRGKTWNRYNRVPYSFDAYIRNQKFPVWVEEGLVTERGTIVLFLTHFEIGSEASRIRLGTIRSYDNGGTWTDYETLDGNFVGYPCSTAVSGETNYVMVDSSAGPHVLYVSTDDGRTFSKRSTMSLDDDKWYGTHDHHGGRPTACRRLYPSRRGSLLLLHQQRPGTQLGTSAESLRGQDDSRPRARLSRRQVLPAWKVGA